MSQQQRWRRRRALLASSCLAALCIVAGCGKTAPARGGLMLIVSSDDATKIGRLDVEVDENGGPLLSGSYRVPEEAQLPTTIGIVSNGNPTAQIKLTITGWSDSAGTIPLDRRDAIVTQIPSDRVATLTVVLSTRCTDKVTADESGKAQSTCGVGETCDGAGVCRSATIVATTLPTYQPGDENDAGVVDTVAGVPGGGGGRGEGGGAGEGGEAGMGGPPGTGGAAGGSGPIDLCLGKVCDTPPASDCESATQFKAYDTTGGCSAGVCNYASHTSSCTCQAHMCTTDPCLTVKCDTPLEAYCKSPGTLTTYAASGTCSAGSCTYVATDQDCPFGCANAACNADPCAAVTCNVQPAAVCKGATTQVTFASTGTCTGGTCSYAATDTTCGSNTQCSGAAVCSVCKADSSCGTSCAACTAGAPKCLDLGTTSKCVGCLSNAECGGATPICSATNTCVARPSCVGLGATCGPSATGDCCASTVVTGGAFYRGYDGVTSGYTSQAYPATVSDFRLDTYEITVGRFRQFVAAYSQTMIAQGAGANSNNPSDTGWSTAWNASLETNATTLIAAVKDNANKYITWTDTPGTAAAEARPINGLDWYEAEAFCIWDGGRLPTEAEWNYAAAGGSEQRIYPWGNSVPGANANLAVYGCYYGGSGTCTSPSNLAPVGSIPSGNGKWGQADLAGNVWEWVQDWNASSYPTPCNNCAYLTASTFKVMRGDGFDGPASLLISSYRLTDTPTDRGPSDGARCARLDK
jgi:formylglycine-generating enzyme